MVEVSISVPVYKSKIYADWVYNSLYEFTPMLQSGEAEFFFIANDPQPELLRHLQAKGYKHYVNYNPPMSKEQMFALGYGWPEYMRRVYRGYNEAIRRSQGNIVVLINSDHYFSPHWLENLLKHVTKETIVCSQLVERTHPKHGTYPGAYHCDCGDSPLTFDKEKFLSFADKVRKDAIRPGGLSYMPCAFYRDVAFRVGLYPEGNIAGKSFKRVVKWGDEAFFDKLAAIGVKPITALDSIVYHIKEGEMDEGSIRQRPDVLLLLGIRRRIIRMLSVMGAGKLQRKIEEVIHHDEYRH